MQRPWGCGDWGLLQELQEKERKEAGRWADVARPCNQWGRSHVRLYPQGSEKPWKAFKLGETQRGAF